MLSGQEQADYNRWNDERNYRYNAYNTERGFDYGQYRDTVGDSQWQSQFDEDARRYNQEWNRKYGKSGSSGGGSGGGGGSSGSSNGGDPNYKGSGYNAAEALVKNAPNEETQRKVINDAAAKGYINKKGKDELNDQVGKYAWKK